MSKFSLSRRQLFKQAGLLGGAALTTNLLGRSGFAQSGPSLIRAVGERPSMPYGVASGDVTQNAAVIWSRCDRNARMWVDYATNESFANAKRIQGPAALDVSDYTAKLKLNNLPEGEKIFYRVSFQSLDDVNVHSTPVTGSFRTIKTGDSIKFAWSGDTAGQGWGINTDWGGMKLYEAMRQQRPDFFIHCGDYIYADGPIQSEVALPDGSTWRNIVTPEKSKVAETLQEFRGNYQYNLLDGNVRRFNAEIPQLVQWDDHETVNNWYPNELLEDDRYTIKSVALLAARAKQALLEYTPIGMNSDDPERIYRSFNYGPALEVFMLDMRSYRGNNTANLQPSPTEDTVFLGNQQIAWLKQALKNSPSTWKVIASDMPVGLVVRDGDTAFENMANGDGPALGRELEMAELLRFIKQNNIRNVVWLTADVHYAANHYYDPNKAQFQDFLPFWEFVTGPINSGTFGPNDLDNTFGPQIMFQSLPDGLAAKNLSPVEGYQFFGTVEIDDQSHVMTVSQHNLAGDVIHQVTLEPEVV